MLTKRIRVFFVVVWLNFVQIKFKTIVRSETPLFGATQYIHLKPAKWQWHTQPRLQHAEDSDAFWNCFSGKIESHGNLLNQQFLGNAIVLSYIFFFCSIIAFHCNKMPINECAQIVSTQMSIVSACNAFFHCWAELEIGASKLSKKR